jgi:hypothetical protein
MEEMITTCVRCAKHGVHAGSKGGNSRQCDSRQCDGWDVANQAQDKNGIWDGMVEVKDEEAESPGDEDRDEDDEGDVGNQRHARHDSTPLPPRPCICEI